MTKKFFLWFFLLIFLTTYSYHDKKKSFSGFFFVEEIQIEGVKNSNKEELEKRLYKIRGKNIIFLSEKDFNEVIKDMNFINYLKIKKIYPKKIKVTVIEDLPIGVYLNDSGERYLLLENNKIIKDYNYESGNLPQVYGEGALEKFSDFYSSFQKTGLDLKLVKQFNYYDINRWDLLLKDEKLIKLPPENYKESIVKFLEIYEKSAFKKFKVFDFRIKNQLIMR
jgi:cell division protein FtsQ